MQATSFDDLKAAIAKVLKKKNRRTKTVVGTMDHEVGWRLQKLASLWGVPQGVIIEVLIRATVEQFRLPYDEFGRRSIWSTSASEGEMEVQGIEAESPGETVPIGEGITSSEQPMDVKGIGEGEGGKKSPAPRTSGGRRRREAS